MTPARAHQLSPFVHAVDDTGALCRAKPRRRWLMSRALPVTCPRCLLRLSRPRWATCEVVLPTLHGAGRLHVRRVGPEGITKSGNPAGARTLCGQLVGWDRRELTSLARAVVRDQVGRDGCPNCVRLAVEPHLESVRLAQ